MDFGYWVSRNPRASALGGAVSGPTWKVYYYAASQMIAMREISGTTGASTRQSYYAYGAPRNMQGTLPTDKTFTGQRAESAALGSLMDFRARFYSPYPTAAASLCLLSFPMGCPEGIALYAWGQSVENLASWTSTGLTFLSSWFAGQTGLDSNNNTFVVGQDVLVSAPLSFWVC